MLLLFLVSHSKSRALSRPHTRDPPLGSETGVDAMAAGGSGILGVDASACIYKWGDRRGVVEFSSSGVEGRKSGVRSLLPSAAPCLGMNLE